MRHRWITGLPLLLLVLAVTAACGDDDEEPVAAEGPSTATIEVALEPLEAVLIEGFDLELVFEAGGEERTVDWNTDVGEAGEASDPKAFYDHVVLQQVGAGPVTSTATMTPGMLDPLEPCVLDLDVAGGSTTRIVVAFDGTCEVAAEEG